MKVILIADVKKVGQRGTLVTVADGYAQNVLIPRKLALPATVENLKKFEREKNAVQSKIALDEAFAKRALADLNGKTIQVIAKANEKEKLFETIHAKTVIEAIAKEYNVSLDSSALTFKDGPIKTLGSHRVIIAVQSAKAEVFVEVIKK
ncbi:50S ribosomal protein L9 [Patescibacteria group bacterium]|nr:MAG: 50S ribosomal protein L9 [Patescibacteria group bacterium]